MPINSDKIDVTKHMFLLDVPESATSKYICCHPGTQRNIRPHFRLMIIQDLGVHFGFAPDISAGISSCNSIWTCASALSHIL